MNNSEILGEEAAVRQIIENDFSATNGTFEDDSITALRANALREKTNLKTLSLPNCETIGQRAIGDCTLLRNVNVDKVKTMIAQGFYGCINLRELRLPSANDSVGSEFLYGARGIIHIDLGECTVFGANSILNYVCDDLVLRRTSDVVRMGHPTGYSANKRGHVYVPRNLISAYQSASNWSTCYANQSDLFRALEDYTVDGTTTGELDQSLANPIYNPVYTLTDQYFDGSSTYIDTGVKLYDGDGKFTIIMKFSAEPAVHPGGRNLFCCHSESSGAGVYFTNNANSINSHYIHFNPDAIERSQLVNSSTSTDKIIVVHSDGLTVRVLTTDFSANLLHGLDVAKTGTLVNHSNNLIIGAHYNDSTNAYSLFWKGTMHKFKVFKNALSGHQIFEEVDAL